MAVKNAKAAARRRAREIALQALYAWKLAGTVDPAAAVAHARTLDGWERCDQEFASQLVDEVIRKNVALESSIAPHLNRSLASLSPVERVILLIGTYELSERLETPFKVVLNEAIDLGRSFGGTDGHKFVNGVLEKLAMELRADEFSRVRQAV